MSDMYEVLRVIAGMDGTPIYAGTIIDASQWRNTKALINAGRLRRLDDDEVAPVAQTQTPKPKAAPKAKTISKEEVIENVN